MRSVFPVPEAIAARHGLDPERLVAAGPDYDTSITLWNGAVTTRPACVARCANTANVQAAVRAARSMGLPLSVRNGGHDWAGRALVEGGMVIDVSAMGRIDVDTRARTARIGAGVRSDALAEATDAAGLTPVTGTVGSVGMLGLILGGGYGPLEGRFGLACDNLVSAQLVTADGSVVEVDTDHDPDLLWALRGGGGNFGVVTSAVVRLHPVGPVYTGLVSYPWNQATSVLSRLADVLDEAPDELSVQTVVAAGPDGGPFIGLLPTWSGTPAQGPAAVAPLERLDDPTSSQMGLVPWHRMIGDMAAMFPAGRHVRIRTRNVAGLTPAVVEALVAAGSGTASALSALSIHPFHGVAVWPRDARLLRPRLPNGAPTK